MSVWASFHDEQDRAAILKAALLWQANDRQAAVHALNREFDGRSPGVAFRAFQAAAEVADGYGDALATTSTREPVAAGTLGSTVAEAATGTSAAVRVTEQLVPSFARASR
jgi:hypothetical protein